MEDEDTTAWIVARLLDSEGYRVQRATELEEAQALLVNHHYDLVISDLRLTGIHGAEGLEVLRCVRGHSPSTRTILLTAFGSDDLAREALHLGANAVVNKPLPPHDLLRLVGELLRAPHESVE